jgi:hypothetical protein
MQEDGEGKLQQPANTMLATQIYCIPGAYREEEYKLFELMKHTTLFLATDPRDKIYVLLGICSDAGTDFPVDYELTPAQPHQAVVRFQVEKHGGCCAFAAIDNAHTTMDPRRAQRAAFWRVRAEDGK